MRAIPTFLKVPSLIALFVITASGRPRLQAGLDFQKYFDDEVISAKACGNFELGVANVSEPRLWGFGLKAGFGRFTKLRLTYENIDHTFFFVHPQLFKIFETLLFNIEINAFFGGYILSGKITHTRDEYPSEVGLIGVEKGSSYDIGLWPGLMTGAFCVISRRFGTSDIGFKCGYNNIFDSFLEVADGYNPGKIGGSLVLGVQASRWFGMQRK